MQGKVLVKKISQKQYQPVIWVVDASQPKGKRQLEEEPCHSEKIAKDIIELREQQHEVFFSDIKEVTVELEGEFYIPRGYYS